MNTRLVLPKLGPTQWLISSLTLAIATGSPIPLDSLIVRRVNIPMTIQTVKSDPPRVAFDQITEQQKTDELGESSTQTINLNQIEEPNAPDAPTAPQSLHRTIELRPMLISKTEPKWIPQLTISASSELSTPMLVQKKQEATSEGQTISNRQGYLIQGNFSLAPEGIAFGPGKRFEVRRKTESGAQESGQIDPLSSQFSIQIKELSGSLVVRLFDEKGGLEGEGKFKLTQLVLNKKTPVAIAVQRTRSEVAGMTGPFTYGDSGMFAPPKGAEKGIAANVLVAGADHRGLTNAFGDFSAGKIHPSSWNLVRAEGAKGYEPGIFLSKAGQETKLPLFREKMIGALRSIALEQGRQSTQPPNGSVVWGRIIQQGKGIAGVTVRAETFPDAQVVYFNQLLIPDDKLTSTQQNGYFAIMDLPSGLHGLVATVQGSYFSHANVVTDENAVSPIEIENTFNYDTTTVSIFDAFTGSAGVAELEMQSLPKPITVFGETHLQLPALDRVSYVKVTPQDANDPSYIMPYMDSDDQLSAPLIKAQWLDGMIAEKRIERIPDTGVVVGFVRDQNFEVYLPHVEAFPADNIIYFDKVGRPSQTGVAGGGFVIINVPQGIQGITVFSAKEDLIQSQVLPVDANSLGLVKYTF